MVNTRLGENIEVLEVGDILTPFKPKRIAIGRVIQVLFLGLTVDVFASVKCKLSKSYIQRVHGLRQMEGGIHETAMVRNDSEYRNGNVGQQGRVWLQAMTFDFLSNSHNQHKVSG